jgi:predicted nucleic acid-binding protein
MNKIFLDINVILDIINPDRPQNKLALKMLKDLIINKYEIVISEDCLTTIFYIEQNKNKVLEFFLKVQKTWTISPFNKQVIDKALSLSLNKNLDLEDVLQCLCAKNNNCDYIITSDKNFYNCGISAKTISEFLDLNKNQL